METIDRSQLVWCATFAALYAFETKNDRRVAMKVAREAYADSGASDPADAVRLLLRGALTWPAVREDQRERWSTQGD
ncbi:MAG TPA: hypothetical protein VIP10_11960 [Burkholderiaceae bacterium]